MTATWGDLFERAATFDASVAAVRRALADRRGRDGGTEVVESGGPGDGEEGTGGQDVGTDVTGASNDDEPGGTNADEEPTDRDPG